MLVVMKSSRFVLSTGRENTLGLARPLVSHVSSWWWKRNGPTSLGPRQFLFGIRNKTGGVVGPGAEPLYKGGPPRMGPFIRATPSCEFERPRETAFGPRGFTHAVTFSV